MDVDCDNGERRKAKRSTQEQVDWWRQTLAPDQRPTDVEGVEVEDPARTVRQVDERADGDARRPHTQSRTRSRS